MKQYSFYNSKSDICFEIELDRNYVLKKFDSSNLDKYYGINLNFHYEKFSETWLRIEYPITFNKKMLSDTSFSFDDKIFIQNYCKSLQENVAIDTVFHCGYSKKYNQNYLTYAYSEKPKYRVFNKIFKSFTVDFDDSRICKIEIVTRDKNLDWDTIKKMHFDVLDKLVITKNCKTK